MNNLQQAIWVEALKARRSKMLFFTLLGIVFIPLGGGFLIFVLKYPELARSVGLVSAKAQLTAGTADWPGYLNVLVLGGGIAGLILFSLIGSWVFGREFSDRTAKDLLALPTSRSTIVLAKYIVIAAWCLASIVLMYLVGMLVGAALDLPPVPGQVLVQSGITLLITAALSLAVIPPIIFFASAGHGYLPPVGVAILAMALSQMANFLGWADTFPWSIPSAYAQTGQIGAASWVIVILTAVIGVGATLLWWERADQTH